MVGIFIPGTMQKNQDVLVSSAIEAICKFAARKVVVVDFYKTRALENLVQGRADIVKFDLHGLADETRNWNDVFDGCKRFLSENRIDTIFCLKMVMMQHVRFGTEDSIRKQVEACSQDVTLGMSYNSTKRYVAFTQFMSACASVCDNFYQVTFDPLEPVLGRAFDFSDFRDLYFNACKRRGSVIMPFYEYEMSRTCIRGHETPSKPFTFYCTAVTAERDYMASMKAEIESVAGWDVNVMTRDKESKRRRVSQDEYLRKLSDSKCSLIIKPYDHGAFSWLRLVECVYSGCLPLVWDDCSLNDVYGAYPLVCDIIDSELRVGSIDELRGKVARFDADETERRSLVSGIVEGIEEKHVTEEEWLRSRWQKLEGLK